MAKANSKLFLVLLLGVLSAFGPFVVDLYLPSLPQLATFFETSASMTQLTLTTAMIGLAVGQLLLGPLSDFIDDLYHQHGLNRLCTKY